MLSAVRSYHVEPSYALINLGRLNSDFESCEVDRNDRPGFAKLLSPPCVHVAAGKARCECGVIGSFVDTRVHVMRSSDTLVHLHCKRRWHISPISLNLVTCRLLRWAGVAQPTRPAGAERHALWRVLASPVIPGAAVLPPRPRGRRVPPLPLRLLLPQGKGIRSLYIRSPMMSAKGTRVESSRWEGATMCVEWTQSAAIVST